MNRILRTLLPIAALALAPAGALAQTIYVDTSNDVVDFGGAQTVADLPGPDGLISLPEAGLASDNTPGVQTIGFHVPQSDWQYQWLYPGRVVLRPFLGFRVFDTVILDARTQTAFTGDTYAGGGEVVIWAESYVVDNFGGEVVGFDHSSINLSGGAGNWVHGNTDSNVDVYDSQANLIGGTAPGDGNTAFAITIDRCSDNVVVGNVVSRLRILGWIGGGMPAANNRVGGPAPEDRNWILGFGTYNSEGAPSGYAIQLFDSVGTLIQNNSIGTTPDGMAPGHRGTVYGIWFDGENHDARILDNRIAGALGEGIGPHYAGWYFGRAIYVYGAGGGVLIRGNTIGLDALGRATLGSLYGVEMANYYLGPVTDVVIGGTEPGQGNEIAGHRLAGIQVGNTFTDARISGNSIHDNAGLGIDLIPPSFQTGVTPNDPLDADAGGNGLQNFPVLQSAVWAGNGVRVSGVLDSAPFSVYEVQVFASPAADPSGYGEGQLYLGRTTVTTDAAGHAAIRFRTGRAAPAGWFVSATATLEPIGATSEFSACVPLDAPPPILAR